MNICKASSLGRTQFLDWVATAVSVNTARTKIYFDPNSAASDCFALNLCAVMLEVCKPFLEADSSSPKKKPAIDANYYFESKRVDVSKDTKIAISSEELDSWVDQRNIARVQAYKNTDDERRKLLLAQHHTTNNNEEEEEEEE
mmetsp:Transcript_31503/g.53208  ORF Transcript_31503/g.53208 Transcript_31503/m.53208 type:complete len:143 (-) Transcript_31503:1276-1704(-)